MHLGAERQSHFVHSRGCTLGLYYIIGDALCQGEDVLWKGDEGLMHTVGGMRREWCYGDEGGGEEESPVKLPWWSGG
eukprot:scaffold11703_cov23-Tisochrysis_lutea.AAC.2